MRRSERSGRRCRRASTAIVNSITASRSSSSGTCPESRSAYDPATSLSVIAAVRTDRSDWRLAQMHRSLESRPDSLSCADLCMPVGRAPRAFPTLLAVRSYVLLSPPRPSDHLSLVLRILTFYDRKYTGVRHIWQGIRYELVKCCIEAGLPPPPVAIPRPMPRKADPPPTAVA